MENEGLKNEKNALLAQLTNLTPLACAFSATGDWYLSGGSGTVSEPYLFGSKYKITPNTSIQQASEYLTFAADQKSINVLKACRILFILNLKIAMTYGGGHGNVTLNNQNIATVMCGERGSTEKVATCVHNCHSGDQIRLTVTDLYTGYLYKGGFHVLNPSFLIVLPV